MLSLETIRSTILVAEVHVGMRRSWTATAISSRIEPGSAPLSSALSSVYVTSCSQILTSSPENIHGSFPALLF
jgi:hypothetical protein